LTKYAAILLIAALPTATAQDAPPAPPARPADPALTANPALDFFQRAKNLYDAARRAPDRGAGQADYERAIPLFTDYLTRFGDHQNAPAAWYYLGDCYYQIGRTNEAERCFHTILNRYRDGIYVAAAASKLAVDHYTRKEFALAATLFERSAANAAKDSDKQRAHYYRAMCLHQLNRGAEAIEAYRQVIKLETEGSSAFSTRASVAIAHLLQREGKDKESLAMFGQLVTAADDVSVRGEAALYAGIVAAKLGLRADSERYLTMVIQTPGMETWRPQAQIALMSNRYEEKKYQEVIDLYQRSAAPAEGEAEARRKMLAGQSYMQLGKNAEALDLFREVERVARPDSDLAFDASYFRLLCFYRIDGQHVDEQVDAFLQIYQKSRPNEPRIHTALLMKAETLFDRRRHREAAETFNAIDATLISDANRPGLLFQRGWCLAVAGDFEGAIRSLTKFLADYPEDPRVPEALAKRGEAALENGATDAALKDFDQLIEANPPAELATFAWQKSARICKDRDDLEGMIRRYSALLEKVPGLDVQVAANASYWIGWGHFKREEKKEALPWLRKARELDAKTYGKQAGVVLVLILFSLQDIDGLATEIDLAFDQGYIEQVPEQALHWIGTQVYNAGRFEDAARFLSLAATPQEPRQTPKVVWRYLAKAQLEISDFKQALESVGHVLEVEEEPIWVADALLDKARALLGLERAAEALEIGNQGLSMRPQGRIGNGLRLIVGDAEAAAGNIDAAIGHYVVVAELVDDKELRPMALKKLVAALEKKGDQEELQRYRKILQDEFPEPPR